jgi:hypothetical protein
LEGYPSQLQPPEDSTVTSDGLPVCRAVCSADAENGCAKHANGSDASSARGSDGGDGRFAEAVAAVMRLPLTDAEKAEAVRRLLADQDAKGKP